MTFEVEQKFHVDQAEQLHSRLVQLGARRGAPKEHRDTYFNHPCRDFVESKEALRIRRIDGAAHVTYKGPKLPGVVKARRELEWRLDGGDPHGDKTTELWRLLGFREVATVVKHRQHYRLDGAHADVEVVLDDVEKLGLFAEIELVVPGEEEVEAARARIVQLAGQLGLRRAEPRSYLQMLLTRESSL